MEAWPRRRSGRPAGNSLTSAEASDKISYVKYMAAGGSGHPFSIFSSPFSGVFVYYPSPLPNGGRRRPMGNPFFRHPSTQRRAR